MPLTKSNKKRTTAAGSENVHPNRINSSSTSSKQKIQSANDNANAADEERIGLRDRKRQKQTQKPSKKDKAEAKKTGKKAKNSGAKMRSMSSLAEALPDLSPTEKEATLAKIQSEFDRNLQVVLFTLDCNYTLLEHQFLGVRALAGVPEDFPGAMKLKSNGDPDDVVFDWVVKVLRNSKPRREGNDRGVLMADSMGLGKTVQAVCAFILRNAIALSQDRPKKPTLIVSPNDAVLTQWHETLLKAGVETNKIFRFVAKKAEYRLKGEIFVLCNRYDLQTEVRHMWGDEKKKTFGPSALLPNAQRQMMLCLKNQYLAGKGKAKNEHIGQGDEVSISEVITDCLGEYMNMKRTYQTVCIDEAHFLKSLMTYWGCAAGMLGLHTERMIAMSGTPYNNSCQDLSTLMTFIDPTGDSALEKWWNKATKSSNATSVRAAVAQWNHDFLVRRGKEVIAANLPQKVVRHKHVASFPLELSVYEHYENNFLSVLQRFQRLEARGWNPVAMKRMKEYFQLMLSFAGCMRSALIHPVLPGGGRDITVLFSPTRSKMSSILKSQERRNRCVCCKRQVKPKEKTKSARRSDNVDNLDDPNLNDEDDDQFVVDDEDEEEEEHFGESSKGTGDVIEIPAGICEVASHGIKHFACETCLANLEESCSSCPQCSTLIGRLRLDSGRQDLLKKKKEAGKKSVTTERDPEDMEIPRPVYCSGLFGGFKASAKLESIVSDFKCLPCDEKCLIVSFFKGSLDLLEAIFGDLGIETARFDGDISNDQREDELERFKTQSSCRILLMTVQTGGTGLNLVCANHVWFVDRFWNPMVMEQCEDRCHRLGATKPVDITYHDVSMTIDDVMKQINDVKSTNATILLADGSKLATATAGLSFSDVSGKLGDAVRASKNSRISHIMSSPKHMVEALPPSDENLLESPSGSQLGQFSSITDAIASMLGYELPPHLPPRKAAPVSSAAAPTGTNSGDKKPTPVETGSSEGMEHAKPAAVASRACVPENTMSFLGDDSSDDDSIPDAVVFGPKK